MAKYINDFILAANKLKKLGEALTNSTKWFLFLDHILDPEYMLVKASIDMLVSRDKAISFESTVDLVCSHYNQILCNGDKQLAAASCRAQATLETAFQPLREDWRRNPYYFPIMPNWLFQAIPMDVCKNVSAWILIANKENQIICQKEATLMEYPPTISGSATMSVQEQIWEMRSSRRNLVAPISIPRASGQAVQESHSRATTSKTMMTRMRATIQPQGGSSYAAKTPIQRPALLWILEPIYLWHVRQHGRSCICTTRQ